MDPTRNDELITVYRDGLLSVSWKGNLWKGPFYLSRTQLFCWIPPEELQRKRQQPKSAE